MINSFSPRISRRGLLAGVGALGAVAVSSTFIGGTTFALWQDTASLPAATIIAGNLDIDVLGTVARDISADRSDSPHDIDLATWRAVPGDTLEIVNQLDMALEGDNLTAGIDLASLTEALGLTGDQAKYVTATATLRALEGNDALIEDSATPGRYLFASAVQGGQGDKPGTLIPSVLDGEADVEAVVTVVFSLDTPDRVLTQANLVQLAEQGIVLQQYRAEA